jgi:son of sevenless-like protein
LFCRALYNYEAQDPASCLSFRRNDVIEVFTQAPSGWWDGWIAMPPDDDKRGWFPSNYVVVISDEEAELAFSGFDLDRPETNVADMEFGRLQGRELANAVPSPRISDFWIPEVSSDGRVSRLESM